VSLFVFERLHHLFAISELPLSQRTGMAVVRSVRDVCMTSVRIARAVVRRNRKSKRESDKKKYSSNNNHDPALPTFTFCA
jgi:hypothetical protein